MTRMNRRRFLKQSAALGAVALAGVRTHAQPAPGAPRRGANEEIRVACVGFNGQGQHHVKTHGQAKDVRVVTLCDVDESQWPKGLKILSDLGEPKPKTEFDIRRVLEDKNVDCISIATPNHWHALATIWACQAGKDVYVEKPSSHNIWEGRKQIETARKYNRIVQHGTQNRSAGAVKEAIALLHEGVIGDVYMARALCYKRRDAIGVHSDEDKAPEGVHYDIWLGPAPKRKFNKNRFLYNWHWHWDYGNGDIGNQGVHQMDIARWGLNRTLPVKVMGMGGRFTYEDQGETPNTQIAMMQYGDGAMLVFEVRGRETNAEENVENELKIGNLFYGSKGYMAIHGNRFKTMINGQPGPMGDGGGEEHIFNFHRAMRSRNRTDLTADIEEGHYSSALCHLANISYRLGRSLDFDPETERFVSDDEANRMVSRQYRSPYSIPDQV